MTSRDLSREQAAQIGETVKRHLRYANRLMKRMDQVGFEPTDPLCRAVLEAQAALQAVCVHTHYASCAGGVGRSQREAKSKP